MHCIDQCKHSHPPQEAKHTDIVNQSKIPRTWEHEIETMSAVKKKKKPKFGKSSWSMIDVAESLDDLPPKPGSLSARSDSMPLSAFPSTAGSDATSSALSREQSQAEESIERGLETLLKADKRSKEKERAEKGAAAIRAAKKSKTRGAKERVKESPSRRRRAASPKKKAKLKKKGSGGDDRIGNDVRSIVRRKLKRKGMEGTVADMFLSSLDYFPDKDSLRESVAGKSKKKPTKVVDIERVWEMAEPFSRKTQDGKDDREEDGDKDKDEDEEEEDILERAKRKGKKKRRGRIPLDPSTASHQWTGRSVSCCLLACLTPCPNQCCLILIHIKTRSGTDVHK